MNNKTINREKALVYVVLTIKHVSKRSESFDIIKLNCAQKSG